MKIKNVFIIIIFALSMACINNKTNNEFNKKETIITEQQIIFTQNLEIETAPMEYFNQIVSSYDKKSLQIIENLTTPWYIESPIVYYDSTNNQPKILEYNYEGGGNSISNTICYFISTNCYFAREKRTIFYDLPDDDYDPDYETEFNSIFFVKNDVCYKIIDNVLEQYDLQYHDLDIKFINGFINLITNNLNMVTDNIENYFDINERGVIIEYRGLFPELVIPEIINNITVTAIGRNAFNGKGLTSVTIPVGVTSIGYEAFRNNEISKILIPESVSYIDTLAFSGNWSAEITIGANVSFGDAEIAIFNYNFTKYYQLPV